MTNEGKGKGNKKSHGAEHVKLFIMVGDNRIELVPQRTSFEGAKRRANDRERGCRRLYDRREKRKKARKKTPWSRSHEVFFWWAMTGSNCRHSACKADALPAELIAHGDLWGIRTPEPAVKGRCLNRLTNRPLAPEAGFEPATS